MVKWCVKDHASMNNYSIRCREGVADVGRLSCYDISGYTTNVAYMCLSYLSLPLDTITTYIINALILIYVTVLNHYEPRVERLPHRVRTHR
jgi:hypothetical protein